MTNREELLNLVRNGVRCPESAKTCDDCQYHSTKYPMHCDEEAALVDMLIANGVVIPVRCEDCDFRRRSERNLWCTIFDKVMPEDGYCGFGERERK